jgi:hypothetical protein
MESWSFLKHGRVLLCIAHDPGVRLRDLAATVGIGQTPDQRKPAGGQHRRRNTN